MFSLFDPEHDSSNEYPTKKVVAFNNVKKTLNLALGRVIAHYQRANYHVEQEHLIYQLLLTLNISMERGLEDYVRVARDRTPGLSKIHKFTHPTNAHSKRFSGVFYNNSVFEYIIATDEVFDIEKAWDNWQNISAVKVHSHPYTDTSMALCDGNYPYSQDGYAVFTINISLLALQYRAWVQLQQSQCEVKPSARRFVHRYVITNMLKRHYDICLINRTMAITLEQTVDDFKKHHPIYVPDYDKQLDRLIAARSEILLNYRASMGEIFHMFQCAWFNTWAQVVSLPDMAPTRYVKWALVLAHLPYLSQYLTLLEHHDNRLDRDVLYRVKRQLRALSVTRGMTMTLDRYANDDYESVIQQLQNL